MDNIIVKDFPAISLAAARVNAKLTQKGLAEACGVSESTVIAWESGRRQPTVGKLKLIEQAVGLSLNFIDFGRH